VEGVLGLGGASQGECLEEESLGESQRPHGHSGPKSKKAVQRSENLAKNLQRA